MKAALLMADGVEEVECTVPYDLLKRAGIDVALVSAQNKTEATGNMGMHWTGLEKMEDHDFSQDGLLVVPGGDAYAVFKQIPEVKEQILAFAKDKILAAICAGSALCGEYGVYKDKTYVCVPGMDGDFGGTFVLEKAVTDGNIVTGISVGGALPFAFAIIRRVFGQEAALKLEKDTCYIL